MASAFELIEVAGREVKVTNPAKVYWDGPGLHQARPGALLPGRGRWRPARRGRPPHGPQALRQRRRPATSSSRSAPRTRGPTGSRRWCWRSPPGRTAEEVVLRDAASLAWVANLGCLDLNPHPVRAEDLDHPDELRVDLDPVPGVPWSQVREVALVAREALEAGRPRRLAQDLRLARHPRQRPHRAALDVRRGAPGRAGPGPRCRAARTDPGHLQVVEGGAPRRLPRLQPERPGPHRRLGLLRPADAGRARLHAAGLGRGARTWTPPTSPWPRCPRSWPGSGDRGAGIDDGGGLTGGAPGAGRPPRGRGPRRCARGRRTTASRTVSRRACGPPSAAHPAARRPGRAFGDAVAHGPAAQHQAAHRDRARGPAGGCPGRPGALEGASPGGGGAPRAGRRPGRCHARPLHDLDAHPRQPRARPGAAAPTPGGAGPRLRSLGWLDGGLARLTPGAQLAPMFRGRTGVDPRAVTPGDRAELGG